ncbi:MAG: hypothetical protein ABW149_09810 [Sedimenticola sp.]
MNAKPLTYALLAGVAYFCCMAVAHFFGIKQPLLFVYYDTPFYAYQDKIISFAVVAYIGLFYAAARQRAVVPVVLWVLGITVLGLASVNLSDALAGVLVEGQTTIPYWIQTALIAGYWIVLVLLYLRNATAQPETPG